MSGADEHKASEWEPGLGSFVLGVAVGVTLGLLFAREDGEAFRGKVARRLRALRELAAEQSRRPRRDGDRRGHGRGNEVRRAAPAVVIPEGGWHDSVIRGRAAHPRGGLRGQSSVSRRCARVRPAADEHSLHRRAARRRRLSRSPPDYDAPGQSARALHPVHSYEFGRQRIRGVRSRGAGARVHAWNAAVASRCSACRCFCGFRPGCSAGCAPR